MIFKKSSANVILDDVKLVDNFDKNMFAIMLDQGDGTYVEDKERTSWPTNYTYNESKSGCIDNEGNKIEDTGEEKVLTFDGEKATIRTNKTVYCYLYFDLNKPKIDDVIILETTVTTIKVQVNTIEGTGNITKYYYGLEPNENYTSSESNIYTYTGLKPGIEYQLYIYRR